MVDEDYNVDINNYPSLIVSWVNAIRRLLDEDYVLHLTYTTPSKKLHWDIPLIINESFYKVFSKIDIRLCKSTKLPLEFERLCQFLKKHEKEPKSLDTKENKIHKFFKKGSFKKVEFY